MNVTETCFYWCRFVKERRPMISPNFNFLGQLQLFQHTLPLKSADATSHTQQPITSPDTCMQTANSSSSTGFLAQDSRDVIKGHNTDTKENSQCSSSVIQSEFTLSLSDKLRTLTLSTERVELQRRACTQPESHSHTHTSTPQKPTHLHIPSLSEKRKSLTLSLTPLCPAAAAHTDQQRKTVLTNSSQNKPCQSSAVLKGEARDLEKEPYHSSRGTTRCSRTQKRRSADKDSSPAPHRVKGEQAKVKLGLQRRERGRRTTPSHTLSLCVSTPQQQEASGRALSGHAVEAVEMMDGDQSLLSPIHLTINRLLGWGERMLLGVLLGPHVKVGHAALPYRC